MVTYTHAGATTHYDVYYDSALPATYGHDMAADWLKVIEQDFALIKSWWPNTAYPTTRVKMYLVKKESMPYLGTWDVNSNYSTQISADGGVDSATDFPTPLLDVRGTFVHEVMEHFEHLTNNGWFAGEVFSGGNEGSTGEALAQVAAKEFYKTLTLPTNSAYLSGHGLAVDWLTNGTPDYVNKTEADFMTSTAPGGWETVIGCGVLFINYLRHLGYTMPQICAATGSTLRAKYQKLTGKTTDPFPAFKADLVAVFPDNGTNSSQTNLAYDLFNYWDDFDPYPLITRTSRYRVRASSRHFRIFKDTTFPYYEYQLEINLANVIENDHDLLKGWWGSSPYSQMNPTSIFVDNPDNPNNTNTGAGYWGVDPGYGTHVNPRVGDTLFQTRGVLISEMMEHFEYAQNKGWFPGHDGRGGNEGTNGEALSIIASREFGRLVNEPKILKGSGWSQPWLNSTDRADFVNVTTPNFFDAPGGYTNALGCGVMFINWLRYVKGYTMAAICQHPAPTLAGVYKALTGSTANAYTVFRADVDARFPPGVPADLSGYTDICNPFVANSPTPTPTPTPTPSPTPTPTPSPTPTPTPGPGPGPGPDQGSNVPSVKGYTFAGATQHFRIYYSNEFDPADARSRALAWLNVVEKDFAVAQGWFGDIDYLAAPVNLFLDLGKGGSGAYWVPSQAYETHVITGAAADVGTIRGEHMAELSEQFMKLQNRGWFHPTAGLEGTNGEALSLVCARELCKQIGANDFVAAKRWYEPYWLNSSRADWVNNTLDNYSKPGGREAVGCGELFLYYLMYELGYSLTDLIAAAAPTPREVYRNLSNDPTDPFPRFKALLDQKYPPSSTVPSRLPDDGFPVSPVPTGIPANEQSPMPDATVNGYVDGLSINGATSQFTAATEFTQFATGDMLIPAVTSGSPLAAVDLCWQLVGNNRLTYFLPTDAKATYWSLQGHEAGFDPVKKRLVTGRDESVYRLFHEKVVAGIPQGAIYRCWRVRDAYSAGGWGAYPDGIYSTAGQGPSPSVLPKTRTHIVATTVPGDSPVKFIFGTDFSDLGFGPNGEAEGFGKYFTVSLDNISLQISGGYRKVGGAPVVPPTASASTQPLNIKRGSVVQILISLEWTDASTFTITAVASLPDFTTVTTSLVMSSTGIDLFAAPWRHTGAIRGLFVQTANLGDDGLDALIGPYETTLPMRTTLQNWGLQPDALILGFTGSPWDFLTQIAVARQIDIRNDNGVIVVTPMRDVAFMSYLWDPVQSPSMSFGLDNTAKFIEVVRNRAEWNPSGVTLYDTRRSANADSYSVTPGTTTQFTVSNDSAYVTLYYTPAPVGRASSITDAEWTAAIAASKTATTDPAKQDAFAAVNAKATADAIADATDFKSPTTHLYGAYCVSGTLNGQAGHSMPAAEWVAYGGNVQVAPSEDRGSLTITITAPVIPGWTGDYFFGLHGSEDIPLVRLVGNGITSTEQTLRFATGSDPRYTNTEVGSTITNIAATSLYAVNNIATRAVYEASGPSIQLSASISMAEVRGWGASIGSLPGSTLLYRNMQWRILSARLSNASVDVTLAPYTTYTSAYWHYNWDGLKLDDFVNYWGDKHWDDYKVAPLSGAIAEWTNSGATVKHTLFPTPDPNNPDVPLEPSESLLPGRFVLPYGGNTITGAFPGMTYPSSEVAASGA